jgi:hypothetical protein
MKRIHIYISILAATLTGLACDAGRGPTAPQFSASLLGLGLPQILACSTSVESSGEAVIGPEGGVVQLGPHSLSIPAGALQESVLISGVAPVGNAVQVRFQPEGLTFSAPATLSMSYAHCGLGGLVLRVVYVDDNFNILELLSSQNFLLQQRVQGRIHHFSSYVLAN